MSFLDSTQDIFLYVPLWGEFHACDKRNSFINSDTGVLGAKFAVQRLFTKSSFNLKKKKKNHAAQFVGNVKSSFVE